MNSEAFRLGVLDSGRDDVDWGFSIGAFQSGRCRYCPCLHSVPKEFGDSGDQEGFEESDVVFEFIWVIGASEKGLLEFIWVAGYAVEEEVAGEREATGEGERGCGIERLTWKRRLREREAAGEEW